MKVIATAGLSGLIVGYVLAYRQGKFWKDRYKILEPLYIKLMRSTMHRDQAIINGTYRCEVREIIPGIKSVYETGIS